MFLFDSGKGGREFKMRILPLEIIQSKLGQGVKLQPEERDGVVVAWDVRWPLFVRIGATVVRLQMC